MKQPETYETLQEIKLNNKKFSEILDKLRDLHLFDITDELSDVYYKNSTDQFTFGLNSAAKIYRK